MGKAKKKQRRTGTGGELIGRTALHLGDQILQGDSILPKERSKFLNKDDQEDQQFLDDKLSRKILSEARKQNEDLQEEYGMSKQSRTQSKAKKAVRLGTAGAGASDDEWTDEDEEVEAYEDIVVDAEDEKALELFMSKEPKARRTLADIIQEKLTEKKTEIDSQFSDVGSIRMQELDPRIVEMYKGVRDILSKYRSGKLPKAFKVLPSLSNWEQLMYLTEPEGWTAAATYQATRIFASNMNAKLAQRFYNLVLFPRIRDDIAEYKRLNFHLYAALTKSLFKPAAFFKGILLPLCESGTCTLREALIVSSVLSKNSLPVLHSCAAMLKLAEMDYTGANSIFLRTLLDKKYALPYRVIDAITYHFLRFTTDTRDLPVLWHQCLLTFCQRYKEDLAQEQKEALMELLRVHSHHQITPEIRRELVQSKCRESTSVKGDDAMTS